MSGPWAQRAVRDPDFDTEAPGRPDVWTKPHRSYFVWEYGKPPEVVIEIVSHQKGEEAEGKVRDYYPDPTVDDVKACVEYEDHVFCGPSMVFTNASPPATRSAGWRGLPFRAP